MKDHSHLDKKTLFMHRTYLEDEGKWHEYFFGTLEANKSTVTAYTEVTPTGGKYYVFEDWFVDLFKENTAKKEFEIHTKKFVPDYTVDHTVDRRSKKV
jgi:hypothetical protein